MRYVGGRNDQPFVDAEGAGANTAADAPVGKAAAMTAGQPGVAGGNGITVQGLPIMKPPYAVISAINLDRGDIQWQVPFGETPDNIRNNPLLKGLKIGNTGQRGECSVLVTKTLLIVGDGLITSGTHPRGAMLRAYNKATGKEVGEIWMPAPQSGGPMTYLWQGKQYIVVAVSGGTYSGEYIAYALPDAE